jgi:hypothetical protein
VRTGTADRPVHADDAAIIEASHANPEAFAELFDRHAPVIHRYIARRIGPQIAEDVAAETFLAAFRRRSRYETQQADARPWLYGIATHPDQPASPGRITATAAAPRGHAAAAGRLAGDRESAADLQATGMTDWPGAGPWTRSGPGSPDQP